MCTSLRNVASFLSNLKQACNCLSVLHFNHVDVNSGLFQATLPVKKMQMKSSSAQMDVKQLSCQE